MDYQSPTDNYQVEHNQDVPPGGDRLTKYPAVP